MIFSEDMALANICRTFGPQWETPHPFADARQTGRSTNVAMPDWKGASPTHVFVSVLICHEGCLPGQIKPAAKVAEISPSQTQPLGDVIYTFATVLAELKQTQ